MNPPAAGLRACCRGDFFALCEKPRLLLADKEDRRAIRMGLSVHGVDRKIGGGRSSCCTGVSGGLPCLPLRHPFMNKEAREGEKPIDLSFLPYIQQCGYPFCSARYSLASARFGKLVLMNELVKEQMCISAARQAH